MFDMFKQAANVTKFKAEQLLRVQSVQNEIGGINQQVSGVRDLLVAKVLELRKNGMLGIPEIDELCDSIEGLQGQIAQKEAQISAIKAETAPQSGTPAPQPGYPPQPVARAAGTKICPSCQALVPAPVMFCPSCGNKFQPAQAEPEPPKATQVCPSCQFAAPAASAFCPNCGQGLAH